MSDQSQADPEAKPRSPAVRIAVDLGGPLAFLVAFFTTRDFLIATWCLVGVSAAALVAAYVLERRIAPMPALAGGAALVFGLLTLIFKDPTFVKMKPTFINVAVGSTMLIGRAMGKSPLKFMLGDALKLTEAGWRRLTLNFGLFALCVGVLNEIVWRTQTDATWVLFRMPGLPLLAFVFFFSQIPAALRDAKAAEAALRVAETQD